MSTPTTSERARNRRIADEEFDLAERYYLRQSLQKGPEAEADLKAAERHARRALRANPSHYEALVLLGDVCDDYSTENRVSPAALRYFDAAIAAYRHRYEAYVAKADSYYAAGMPEKAEPYARKGWELVLGKHNAEAFEVADAFMVLGWVLVNLNRGSEIRPLLALATKHAKTAEMRFALKSIEVEKQRIGSKTQIASQSRQHSDK